MTEPSLNDIRGAAARIQTFIHRTPVLTCRALDERSGARLFFKCENFQKAGAFKIRGAANAVLSLTAEEVACGVATHSSGNHAAALALAARWRGIRAHVVMPENAPAVKQAAVRAYGAEITFCAPTLQAREEILAAVLARTGAAFIPPYNHYRVICGQGTAALEFIEVTGELDLVITPVGGGGLLSGTAIAVAALLPKCRVLGAEPATADDARRSLQAGHIVPAGNPVTVADGLRTSLGTLTFPILQRLVTEIITAGEAEIIAAMRLIWERMKIVVEPSAAVPVAAVLAKAELFLGKRVGVILSGGNVDLDQLPWH